MDWISAVAQATTGAGGGAAQPMIEWVLSWVFAIAGAGIIIGCVFKGLTALAEDHLGRLVGFVVTLLVVLVIIGSARQIASAVTGFAGGATLTPDTTDGVALAVLGYLLGDLLWLSVVLGGGLWCYAWLVWPQRQVRHGD